MGMVSRRMAKRRRPTISGRQPSGIEGPDQSLVRASEQLTFQIFWKPLPPGVDHVGTTLTTLFSDESVNWMKDAMDYVLGRAREEPPSSMELGKCRVVARVAPARLLLHGVRFDRYATGRTDQRDAYSSPVVLEPVNGDFEFRFSERDLLMKMDRAVSTIERLRNYVAFSSGMSLPLVGVIVAKEFMLPITMESPPQRYGPRLAESAEILQQGWTTSLTEAYSQTSRLVKELEPNDAVARATSLVGEAICSSDVEERFFYAWRALEVIGNLDLKTAQQRFERGELEAVKPYINRNVASFLGRGPVKLDPKEIVATMLDVRVPELKPNPAESYYELRNAIAHGDVTTEQHAAILKASFEITALAHRVTVQVLGVNFGHT